MRRWNYNNPFFIILRDNDGGDCINLKANLSDIAQQGKNPFKVRIVCQQLESLLLGDLQAIRQAYPGNKICEQAKFRRPDNLINASQELEKLIKISGKIDRAQKIGGHFDFQRNCSPSFNVFLTELEKHEPPASLSGAF